MNLEKPSGWLIDGKGDTNLVQLHEYFCNRYGTDFFAGLSIFELNFIDKDLQPYVQQSDVVLNAILTRALKHENILEPVRLAWSNNMRFNALAMPKFNGTHFIVINIGVVPILQSLYGQLMSSPTFRPDIGNIAIEIPQEKIKIRNDISGVVALGPKDGPKCPIRRAFASMLASEASKFLLLHEFTHIAHGHVSPNTPLVEIAGESDLADNIQSHTLEMDADAGAVVKSFNELIGFFERDLQPETVEQKRIANLKVYLGSGLIPCIETLSLMLSGLFALFPIKVVTRENMFHGKHPQAVVRLLMAFAVIESHILRSKTDMPASDIQNAVGRSLKDFYMEIDLSEGANNVLRSGSALAMEENEIGYVRALKKCWASDLYPILNARKLTSTELAPPTE